MHCWETQASRQQPFPSRRVHSSETSYVHMKLGRPQIGLIFLSLAFAISAHLAIAKRKETQAAQMDQRKQAVHALNRLTFGPRPGDVDHVMAIGLDKWIDQQLHPEKIDDSMLEARLSPLRTLR